MKNLEAMLLNQIGMIENATTRIENLEQRQKAIVRNLESCLQNKFNNNFEKI